MKILIVSDTHRREDSYKEVLAREQGLDRVIHLGDAEQSEDYMQRITGLPLDIVSGNNDFFYHYSKEKEIDIGKYKILLTHGHNYYVSSDIRVLCRKARAQGMDIVMYGHTHYPRLEECEGVMAVNPGSLSYPRQQGRRPSYMIMETDEKGEAQFTIKYME